MAYNPTTGETLVVGWGLDGGVELTEWSGIPPEKIYNSLKGRIPFEEPVEALQCFVEWCRQEEGE